MLGHVGLRELEEALDLVHALGAVGEHLQDLESSGVRELPKQFGLFPEIEVSHREPAPFIGSDGFGVIPALLHPPTVIEVPTDAKK